LGWAKRWQRRNYQSKQSFFFLFSNRDSAEEGEAGVSPQSQKNFPFRKNNLAIEPSD